MPRTRRGLGDIELAGATVLVTGAGSGIGRATALAFARERAQVLCADIGVDAAEKTAAMAAEAGAPAHAYEIDVADRSAMASLAERVTAEYGPLDVLVNNAGVGMTGRFLDSELEDWEWLLGINLLGVIHGCKAFAPAMVERGRGHVVNISSALGYVARSTESTYCTSKAAVLMLSRCLRADWHGDGVGVSAVCPGVINTPIVRSTRYRGEQAEPEKVARFQRMFATRGHDPELVADAVLDAVRRNRSVVPVGIEARLGLIGHRFLPTAVEDRMSRMTFDGI